MAFPAAMTVTLLLAMVLLLVGNVSLGLAVWRSGVLPPWADAVGEAPAEPRQCLIRVGPPAVYQPIRQDAQPPPQRLKGHGDDHQRQQGGREGTRPGTPQQPAVVVTTAT